MSPTSDAGSGARLPFLQVNSQPRPARAGRGEARAAGGPRGWPPTDSDKATPWVSAAPARNGAAQPPLQRGALAAGRAGDVARTGIGFQLT